MTGEFAGPDFNGGIGTANRGLALALRDAGFSVDVLYTRVEQGAPFCFRGTFADQVRAFAGRGISLMSILHSGPWNDWPAKSFRAMEHLQQHKYDLAFFNDTHGTAYYPLLARRTGSSELSGTAMCVVAHSATQWIQQINQSPIESIEDLKLMEMERRSLELADFIVAPSRYILEKYRGYGWALPKNARILPNVLPKEERRRSPGRRRHLRVDELVFFGRLESRKGLWLFCNALDRIKMELDGRTVTFLGKPTFESGESTAYAVVRRSAAWPFAIRLLHNYDREQALDYLKGARRLAIMPSLEDNSPCVIQECLQEGIPFIASSGSGGEELLSDDTKASCLFEPTAAALSRKILETLEQGASTGTLSFDPDESERAMMDWVRSILAHPHAAGATGAAQVAAASGRPTLIAIVPGNVDADRAASQATHIHGLFDGDADLLIVTLNAAELSARLAGLGRPGAIQVASAPDYGAAAQVLAEGKPSIVGLFHIMRPITPEWLARARLCLAADPDIAGLAGLVGSEDTADVDALPSHVSIPAKRRLITRFRLGASSALLPLSPETNSGFAAIRGEAIAALASVTPFDGQYGRLKALPDWIDELFLELHLRGLRYEVLPDVVLDDTPTDGAFEIYRRGAFARSLVTSQLQLKPGSSQALLARLAIEASLGGDRHAAMAECLARIADKLGVQPQAWSTGNVDSDDVIRLLSKVAYASGQIELAEDLLAQSVLAGDHAMTAEAASLDHIIRVRANEIRLVELLARGSYNAVNLDHAWSFKLWEPDRTFEMHPNPPNEGRATLLFPSVDLGRIDRFRGSVRVANDKANPVRFSVDVVACNRSFRLHNEQVADPAETKVFEFDVPPAARACSNIVLTTEMATHFDSTADAWARWIDPNFCSLSLAPRDGAP